MNDPKRLSASDDAVERTLLRAGRVIAPPGSKERALAVASGALGASAAVAGGAAAGKGTAFGIAKAGSIASLKWFGIVSLTGIGLTASAVVVHEVRESLAPASVDTVARGDKPPAVRKALPRAGKRPSSRRGMGARAHRSAHALALLRCRARAVVPDPGCRRGDRGRGSPLGLHGADRAGDARSGPPRARRRRPGALAFDSRALRGTLPAWVDGARGDHAPHRGPAEGGRSQRRDAVCGLVSRE